MTDDAGLLDTSRLDALAEEIGDREVVVAAVQSFVAELPQRMTDIRQAVDAGDDPQVGATAHALGSPAAMLGAVAVRSTTRALQDASKEGRSQEYAGLLGDLDDLTTRTVGLMRDYLGDAAGF